MHPQDIMQKFNINGTPIPNAGISFEELHKEGKGIHIDQAVTWLEAVAKSIAVKEPCSKPSEGWNRCYRPFYGTVPSKTHWILDPNFGFFPIDK